MYGGQSRKGILVDHHLLLSKQEVHSRVLQHGPLTHFGNLISKYFGLLDSDLLDISARKNTLIFRFPVPHLMRKCGRQAD